MSFDHKIVESITVNMEIQKGKRVGFVTADYGLVAEDKNVGTSSIFGLV